jgi:hypothetical protein
LTGRSGWREDISIGDDLEYYARLLVDAGKVCFVDETLFVVREHPGDRLSVGALTASAVKSLLKARRSVFESAVRAGMWDEQVQISFLQAMRSIYAGALLAGDQAVVDDLERWMWKLACSPRRRLGVQSVICARRLAGAGTLLAAHSVLKRFGKT